MEVENGIRAIRMHFGSLCVNFTSKDSRGDHVNQEGGKKSSWKEGAEAFLTLPIEASAGVKCKMHKGVFASLRSEWEGKGMD
ncbi:hypothetical protein AHAS_Ahas06G0028600 [Arachis hypogaea]